MNGKTIRHAVTMLALAVLVPAAAWAFGGNAEAGFGQGRRGEPGAGRHLARMAEVLDLSSGQQEQIAAIRAAEREKAAPLRQALAENRERLRAAIEAQPFDEAAVRALAAGQAATRTELIVARARTQSQFLAVLTPEQRALAGKLRPLLHERRGPRPPCPEPEEE